MTKITPPAIIGTLVACCWLPLIFALFPFPNEDELFGIWIMTLMLFSLGVCAAVMTFVQSKYWRISVIGTSLLYLAAYLYDLSSFSASSFVEAVRLDWELAEKLRNANTTDVYVFSLIKNFVLPAMHVMLVACVTLSLFSHKRKDSESQ